MKRIIKNAYIEKAPHGAKGLGVTLAELLEDIEESLFEERLVLKEPGSTESDYRKVSLTLEVKEI